MDDQLLKIENFFTNNLKIKKLIYNLKPSLMDSSNKIAKMDYIINFLNTMDQIKSIMLKISDNFYKNSDINEIINNHFEEYDTIVLNNYNDLEDIYKRCCSNMDSDLIEIVKDEFCGYKLMGGNIRKALNKASTINEILHVLHSSIVNNELYYQSVPEIARKCNEDGENIILRGKENELAEKLFFNFPVDIESGSNDIVSLNDKILMMIRDRGHALSIEMDIDGENVWVKYFIPKICNHDMASKLKGINLKSNEKTATGEFLTDKDNLLNDIYTFVAGVPMDDDMFLTESNIHKNR